MKRIFTIEGMSCGHCVMHVTHAIEDVPGVSRAKVDLKNKQAVVEGEVFDSDALKKAVAEAGYEAFDATEA